MFYCGECQRRAYVCGRCDRGQIYCSEVCSEEARRRSVREAGCRYQQTFRGAANHAERQRRYRERQRAKREREEQGDSQDVTHQGSADPLTEPMEEAKDNGDEGVETTVVVAVEPLGPRSEAESVDASDVVSSADAEPERETPSEPPDSWRREGSLEHRCSFCGRRASWMRPNSL